MFNSDLIPRNLWIESGTGDSFDKGGGYRVTPSTRRLHVHNLFCTLALLVQNDDIAGPTAHNFDKNMLRRGILLDVKTYTNGVLAAALSAFHAGIAANVMKQGNGAAAADVQSIPGTKTDVAVSVQFAFPFADWRTPDGDGAVLAGQISEFLVRCPTIMAGQNAHLSLTSWKLTINEIANSDPAVRLGSPRAIEVNAMDTSRLTFDTGRYYTDCLVVPGPGYYTSPTAYQAMTADLIEIERGNGRIPATAMADLMNFSQAGFDPDYQIDPGDDVYTLFRAADKYALGDLPPGGFELLDR